MQLSVFTKPWKTMEISKLAEHVRGLGFDGVELPVRAGFQVEPDQVEQGLPHAAKVFGDQGLKIFSVASPIDEPTIAACGAAGVPIVRICMGIDPSKGYRACIDEFRRRCEQLVPALERSKVTIGLQNHHGNDIGSALGIMQAIEPFNRKHVAAVLDVAHCALAGEPEEIAIDIAWAKLCMVNLKNGYRRRVEDEAGEARWKVNWVGAKEGLVSWRKTMAALTARGYDGPLCLTAEYSDPQVVDRQIAEDLAYARELSPSPTGRGRG
ncbi:MAG TPA: sugar phosphate isomerase/epimerase family protein [Tepidisphaeraceae bacterium]|jgi:sugar phosphate isomerase/epimerase